LLQPPFTFSAKPGETILLECPGVGNPVPIATWSRPDHTIELTSSRISVLSYGLQIENVTAGDEGVYICRLDNGISSVHTMKLNVLQSPVIVEGPRKSLTNESDQLKLFCEATGSPQPDIYWMINGENVKYDPQITTQGAQLIIRSVEKKHAGTVQCFAKNEVGEVSQGALLQVNPKQVDGEGKPIPTETLPPRARTKNNNRSSGEKRNTKGRESLQFI